MDSLVNKLLSISIFLIVGSNYNYKKLNVHICCQAREEVERQIHNSNNNETLKKTWLFHIIFFKLHIIFLSSKVINIEKICKFCKWYMSFMVFATFVFKIIQFYKCKGDSEFIYFFLPTFN